MERFFGAALQFNPWALGAFFCAAACLVMCVIVLQRRSRAHIRPSAFVPAAMATIVWNFGGGMGMLMDPSGRPAIVFVVASVLTWTAPASLMFVTAFTPLKRRNLWLGAMVVAAMVSSWLIWTDPLIILGGRPAPWGGRIPELGPHSYLVVVPLNIGLGFSIALALISWRREPPGRRRRQLGYVLLTLFTAMLGTVDLLAAKRFLATPMPLGWTAGLAATTVGFYVTVKYRLMAMRALLSRVFFWLLLVAGSAAPLAILIYVVRDWSGWRSSSARVVAILWMLVALHFYLTWLARGLRRFLGRNVVSHELAMAYFAAGLRMYGGTGFHIAPLAAALRQLDVEINVVAWAVDAGDGLPEAYVLAPVGAAQAPRTPGSLLPEHSVLRDELELRADLPTDDERERDLVKMDQEALVWLDTYGGNMVIPLGHGSQNIGVIVASLPDGRTIDAVRSLLDRIATHVAVSLINSELFQEIEERSADLERTVTIRTRELSAVVDELKVAQASLVHAERQSSLGVLVAGVSHEINNALNFIYGNLPALSEYAETYQDLITRSREAKADVDDKFAETAKTAHRELIGSVSRVDRAAQQAREIVDDLRRFARRDEQERGAADVSEGLASTLNLLGTEFRGRVRIERVVAADVPEIICYPGSLNHVFLNIILNAVQASDDDGVVQVALCPGDAGGVRFVVTDQGPGIAEELRARIFEPFYTTKENAAGLGLSLTRDVVELHGGTIEVTDNPMGTGTQVTVSLPAKAKERMRS